MTVYMLRLDREGLDDLIYGIFTSRQTAKNIKAQLQAALAPKDQWARDYYYIKEINLDTYYTTGRP